jgi:predicted transcriptional regulator of viral defense system
MTTTAFYQKLSGQKRVTTRMAAQLAGLSIPAASMALRRLAADGLSLPLKKGSWIIGGAASKPGALVTAAADPFLAYLSGWSALRVHELIQQLPQTLFAITLGRPGEMEIGGSRIALHRIRPELFGGYHFNVGADGFVATPEKAIFDLAYLTAMNRSQVSGNLPETDLRGIRWKDVQGWMNRIPTPRMRAAVERALRVMRERHANAKD